MRTRSQIFAVLILMVACGRRTAPLNPPAGAAAHAQGAGQGATAAPPGTPVEFTAVSDIPECLTVVRKGSTADSNLLLGIVELATTQITAACGCTSKWLLYRSVTTHEGLETSLASGSLLAPDPGGPAIERRVVLLGDREHPPSDSMTLRFGCEPAP
jgi:hypothetical protein